MGLRERKKAKTRKLISDVATRLFIERGYDAVTTAEIAQLAEVSVTTLFNYFPTKEALVYDEDESIEAALVHAIVSRSPDTTILKAVRAFFLAGPMFRAEHEQPYADFAHLIDSTPGLAEYGRQMMLRYEKTLAQTIETAANEGVANKEAANEESAKPKISKIQAEALAHYILEAVTMAQRYPHSAEAFSTILDMLRDGADV